MEGWDGGGGSFWSKGRLWVVSYVLITFYNCICHACVGGGVLLVQGKTLGSIICSNSCTIHSHFGHFMLANDIGRWFLTV